MSYQHRPIYEAAFDDVDDVLSPEKAHARAQKEALRMDKQRELVSVTGPLIMIISSFLRALSPLLLRSSALAPQQPMLNRRPL